MELKKHQKYICEETTNHDCTNACTKACPHSVPHSPTALCSQPNLEGEWKGVDGDVLRFTMPGVAKCNRGVGDVLCRDSECIPIKGGK